MFARARLTKLHAFSHARQSCKHFRTREAHETASTFARVRPTKRQARSHASCPTKPHFASVRLKNTTRQDPYRYANPRFLLPPPATRRTRPHTNTGGYTQHAHTHTPATFEVAWPPQLIVCRCCRPEPGDSPNPSFEFADEGESGPSNSALGDGGPTSTNRALGFRPLLPESSSTPSAIESVLRIAREWVGVL